MAVVTATVAALGAGGVAAYAAIPDSSGRISSCYDTSTGAMRVVDNPSTYAAPTCNSTEKPLTFAQRGPAGPTGMRGPAGPVDVHWAKFSANGTLLAASEKPAAYYAYGQYGYDYVSFSGVDVTKCSVTITAGYNGNTFSHVNTSYYAYGTTYILAMALDDNGNFQQNIPMDVVLNCNPSNIAYTP